MDKVYIDAYNMIKKHRDIIHSIDTDFFFNFVDQLLEDFALNSVCKGKHYEQEKKQ